MKPVYLSIEGLNSFSERVGIDFTKLTQSGIFGIFGDTGSGKSSILDGINFALYGNVGRSKVMTDIINYNCDKVEVKFEFNVLNCGKRKNYTIERSINRKGSHSAFLYEEDNGVKKQIADKVTDVKDKVVDIIGVSAEDFRKCIALPQGEFSEFVQSVPSKRLELIERLFDLSKYGDNLKKKLNTISKAANDEYQKTSGEMIYYENITDEMTKELEREIIEEKNNYKQLEVERESSLKKFNEAESLYKERLILDDAEENIRILYINSDEMEKLRKNLELLPECKRICDEEKFKAEIEKNITNERTRLLQIEDDIKRYELLAKQANEELYSFDYQQKIADISEKSARLSAAKDKFSELGEIHEKLKKSQFEYEELKKEKHDKQNKLNSYQTALDSLKKDLKALPDLKIENLLSDDVKNAIAHSVYNDEFIFICDLRENIKGFKSDSKLYNYVFEELNQRISYLKEIICSIAENKTDVNLRLEDFKKNLEAKEELSSRISKGEQVLSACRGEISILEEKIRQKLTESAEKSESFQQILSELSGEYGNNPDYEKIQTELNKKKKLADNEYNRLKTDFEQKNSKLSELREKKISGLKFVEQYSKEVETRQEKISELLSASGFDSVDKCKNLLDEFGDFEKARTNLEDYDRRITLYKAIIEQRKHIEGIRDITEDKVTFAKDQMNEKETSLQEKNLDIKRKEDKLESLQETLIKKKDVVKRLKKITAQKNLISQLESLIHGNEFMKYVADGHLSEISKVASKMLLDLTDGRYFLVYKKDNFYVGDNFNGGEERGVNTLSGGETFLVSLSLALALSGVICARSDKDIEFFFLDEGFGTLDETLIEVVMGALEKLKNSNFTIGIISHVEELKHRIESKIIVNKATESHGSTLTLSC